MSPLLKNLALILASTALALGVVETAIRRNWIPEPAFVDAEGWWRENWLRHRRGPNPRHFVQLDTDLGWIPTPNLRDEPYQEATISTNSLGMRGTRELGLERGAAARIVAVGDSFTFGQCANEGETWPAQLERILVGSEVMNLGVMGYGHDQALLRLRRDGLPYRPDAVVLGFHVMDMSRNRLRFRDYSKPRFRIDGDELEVENVPVPDPEIFDSFFYPRLLNFVSITVDRVFEERAYDQGRDLTREILRHMARETHAAGARFVLLWLPRQKDVEEGKDALPGPVRDACEEDGILCASPTDRIREALDGKPLRRHFKCHYSPLVYRLVAEEAARVLHRSLPKRIPKPDLSGPPPAPPR